MFFGNTATEINGGALLLFRGIVQLKDSTFSGNTAVEVSIDASDSSCRFLKQKLSHAYFLFFFHQGDDIYIEDDGDLSTGATEVLCDGATFCGGLDGIVEFGKGAFNNTDCGTNGVIGNPGVDPCP